MSCSASCFPVSLVTTAGMSHWKLTARHSGRGYRESSKRPGPLKGVGCDKCSHTSRVSAHLHVWALELPQCRMGHQRSRSVNEPVSVSLRARGPVWLNLWDKHVVLTGTAPRPRPRRTRPEHPNRLLSMWAPSGLTWAVHKHHSDIRSSGRHSWWSSHASQSITAGRGFL